MKKARALNSIAKLARKRRQAVLDNLGGPPLLLRAAPEVVRNGDVHFSYRQDSNFHYLTGFEEPDAILVAIPGGGKDHKTVLFVRPRNAEREIWDGKRYGISGAKRQFGADEAYKIEEFWDKLDEIGSDWNSLAVSLGVDPGFDRRLLDHFGKRLTGRPRRNQGLPSFVDPRPAIHERRLIKSPDEVECLATAARITTEGHKVAMAIAEPGMYEYEVQAEVEAVFRREGSPRNGYPSIVGSGPNACTLHYVANDRRMRRGELLLIDAGAEYGQYSADVTRTFPIAGPFSDAQKAIYELVLRTQKKCIRAVRPGTPVSRLLTMSQREITKGLLELHILRGRFDTNFKKKKFRDYYMHGLGHWLGMDVHDCGAYEQPDGKPIVLEPGMVATVEPGIYIRPNDKSVKKEFRGIGVRIEDDILVTRDGNRNLTEAAPKEIKDVEALTG